MVILSSILNENTDEGKLRALREIDDKIGDLSWMDIGRLCNAVRSVHTLAEARVNLARWVWESTYHNQLSHATLKNIIMVIDRETFCVFLKNGGTPDVGGNDFDTHEHAAKVIVELLGCISADAAREHVQNAGRVIGIKQPTQSGVAGLCEFRDMVYNKLRGSTTNIIVDTIGRVYDCARTFARDVILLDVLMSCQGVPRQDIQLCIDSSKKRGGDICHNPDPAKRPRTCKPMPVTGPKAEKTAGPVAQPKTVEPKAAEPKTAKAAAEPKAAAVAEPKAEKAAAKTAEPKAEKTAEPKTEKAAAKTAEPVAEPKTEKAAEPKTEKAAAKTAEPKTEKAAELKSTAAVRWCEPRVCSSTAGTSSAA